MVKIEKICVGNLMECTKYAMHTTMNFEGFGIQTGIGYTEKESKVLEEDVCLLKVKNGGYVRLDSIHKFSDYLRINQCLTKDGYKINKFMLGTSAVDLGEVFVNEESLKTIHDEVGKKNFCDIKKLQKMFKTEKATK